MSADHYTYMHLRGDTGKPFYIGKGTGARASNTGGRNRHWHNIVNAHGRTIQILAHWPTHEEALEHEKALIASFRSMGLRLANITDGGDGTLGRRQTDDAKRRISEANTGKVPSQLQREASSRRWKGVPKSAEQRAKISAANLGRTRSQEVIDSYLPALRAAMARPDVRAKIASAARGRVASAETRAKMSKKKLGLNLGRRLTQETKALLSAARKANGKDPAYRAMQSRAHGGRPFVHVESGVVYESQGHAANSLGISRVGICNTLSGKQKTTGGQTFKHVNGDAR